MQWDRKKQVLRDEEIEALCKLPHQSMEKIYGGAKEWWRQNKEWLRRDYPGKHLTLNAETFTYVITEQFEVDPNTKKLVTADHYAAYVAKYGPTPHKGWRHMFDVWLIEPIPAKK